MKCEAVGRYLFVVQPRADTCLHFAEIEIRPSTNSSLNISTSDALVLSHQALSCPTPAWGTHFPHGNVSVSVEYMDASNRMSILPCIERANPCSYHLYEVVSGLHPVQGLAAVGNISITVQGYGFRHDLSYALRFSGGGFNVSEPLQNFISPTELIFQKPMWLHAATTTSVELESFSKMSASVRV